MLMDHRTMKISSPSSIARLGCAALLAALVALAACSGVAGNAEAPAPKGDTPAPTAPAMPVKLAAPVKPAAPVSSTLRQQIVAEIGNASCGTSAQCRTLPVGSRACGGPEGYLAYSTKTGDAAKMQRMAAQESAARKEQDRQTGGMSTCQMMMDPGATCQAGRCTSGNASGGELPTR